MMEYLEGLTDPRQQKKVLHSFTETIMLVICAAAAGCDVWEDIADYCRVKEEWFREKLGLKLEALKVLKKKKSGSLRTTANPLKENASAFS